MGPRQPRPALLRSRDAVYLMIILALLIYHYYEAHARTILSSAGPDEKFDIGLLPPVALVSGAGNMHQSQSEHDEDSDLHSIPLDKLTAVSNSTCTPPLQFLPNHINAFSRNRKIPKMIHMTSKSRCFPSNFFDNIRLWPTYLKGHSLYLHDDASVERLLSRKWPLFPHLNMTRRCLRSGAGLADLWRYLVLYEYGGIYTDIDNAPGKHWAEDTIKDDDDAFFVIEKLGVLSQYFLAVSPKHPLMYLCIQLSLHRILGIDHVGKQNVPVVSGPGALKVAFKYFMRTHQVLSAEEEKKWKQRHPNATRYGRVKAGKYFGVGNRSVTIVGTKDTGSRWVVRGSVEGKGAGYEAMGMRHFSMIAKKKFNESCLVHLWTTEFDYNGFNATNW